MAASSDSPNSWWWCGSISVSAAGQGGGAWLQGPGTVDSGAGQHTRRLGRHAQRGQAAHQLLQGEAWLHVPRVPRAVSRGAAGWAGRGCLIVILAGGGRSWTPLRQAAIFVVCPGVVTVGARSGAVQRPRM